MITRLVDNALDASVVGGFSRIGYLVRSRAFTPLNSYDLTGKTVVVTGPTSGLGLSTVRSLRAMNADLVLVGRQPDKLRAVSDDLISRAGAGKVQSVTAEMGNLASVVEACRQISDSHTAIDALVHNAGALLDGREVSVSGVEQTIASHVVGPFVMTSLLLPLVRAAHGRVITVSSGGMYAVALSQLQNGQSLEMSPNSYDGTKQYAIAKRAQVTLNQLWAEHETDVEFHAMHPGWADTPGVESSLPTFRKVMRPLLRSTEQGADTIVWLCAEQSLGAPSGTFWCDRTPRSVHRLPGTKRSDTRAAREALWAWCRAFVPTTQ